MLKSRLITALVLIPLVIAALFWLPLAGFTLVLLAICMLSAWEWGQFAGLTTRIHRIWLALLFGLLLASMAFSLPAYQPLISLPAVSIALWSSLSWWTVALLFVLTYPSSARFWRQSRFLRLFFGLLTLMPFFWGMMVLRRYHYDGNHYAGAWWLLFVLLLVWGADSGAYLFGKLFGRHKLIPSVSPGKTWEGLAGGILVTLILAYLFTKISPFDVPSSVLVICSTVATLASVLGDLTESMFKREAGIKDSGQIIPGHGGILDRIDSLTAAVPVFTCLLLLVYKII